MDKNIAIVGGFAEKTIEEAEHLVREMMTHVHGFEDVAMTNSSPAIALVHFQSPAQSMKFIRGHKNNMHIQTIFMWYYGKDIYHVPLYTHVNRSRTTSCFMAQVKRCALHL